ncbi:siderophore ABC transporter substrate-binding protein [Snodgrassella communis]|uniref:siderophore ABC transporter substrate-binding protein n=1 Tax=Snodgrassella communis TaxID=2946699 RepID=UPI001EF60F31|nr:ABC transporter substrate-binding protein [Snodgrassella communis]
MKKILAMAVLSALALGLSACQSTTPVTVTQTGEELKLAAAPQKIVVMDFGALDTLDALHVGDRVVAVPEQSIPSYLHQYQNDQVQNAGQMKEPDLAAIQALKPDLIIMSGRQNAFYKDLSAIAPTLNYFVNPADGHYYEDVKKHIRLLGKIAGKEALAQQQLKALDLKMNAARELAQHSAQKAIVVLHNDGNVILVNQGAFSALIFDELKIKPAVTKDLLPTLISSNNDKPTRIMVDNRFIAQYQPDIVYVIDRSKAIGKTPMRNDYFDDKILQRAGTKVVYLSADLWYLSGNGLQSLNRQIDEVIKPLNDVN